MTRFLAGAVASFLMLTGAFLLWQGKAEQAPTLPAAPPPRAPAILTAQPEILEAPEASPKSREEKRFSRADKDKNGRVEAEEMLQPRRKAFAKLDKNGNGTLSFDEWGVKTIDKLRGADRDRSGWLSAAEFRTTAPRPKKEARCAC